MTVPIPSRPRGPPRTPAPWDRSRVAPSGKRRRPPRCSLIDRRPGERQERLHVLRITNLLIVAPPARGWHRARSPAWATPRCTSIIDQSSAPSLRRRWIRASQSSTNPIELRHLGGRIVPESEIELASIGHELDRPAPIERQCLIIGRNAVHRHVGRYHGTARASSIPNTPARPRSGPHEQQARPSTSRRPKRPSSA